MHVCGGIHWSMCTCPRVHGCGASTGAYEHVHVGPPTRAWEVYLPVATSSKKSGSPPASTLYCNSSIIRSRTGTLYCNSSFVKDGAGTYLPCQCWDLGWLALGQVTTSAVHSWVHWPCHVQKTASHSMSHPQPLLLTSFPALFCKVL